MGLKMVAAIGVDTTTTQGEARLIPHPDTGPLLIQQAAGDMHGQGREIHAITGQQAGRLAGGDATVGPRQETHPIHLAAETRMNRQQAALWHGPGLADPGLGLLAKIMLKIQAQGAGAEILRQPIRGQGTLILAAGPTAVRQAQKDQSRAVQASRQQAVGHGTRQAPVWRQDQGGHCSGLVLAQHNGFTDGIGKLIPVVKSLQGAIINLYQEHMTAGGPFRCQAHAPFRDLAIQRGPQPHQASSTNQQGHNKANKAIMSQPVQLQAAPQQCGIGIME